MVQPYETVHLAFTVHPTTTTTTTKCIAVSYIVDGIVLQEFLRLGHIGRVRVVDAKMHCLDVRSKEITDNRHFGIALQQFRIECGRVVFE